MITFRLNPFSQGVVQQDPEGDRCLGGYSPS